MRKKYLSALLFGALLFASAGTFTSCKDYDDDINGLREDVTSLQNAVTTLQNAVESGKYVTAVSGDGNVITFTFTDGTTQQVTVETAAQEAQTVTIGEDGEVIINGEGTGYYTTKTPTEAEVEVGLVKKGANGTWEVLGEDGEYTGLVKKGANGTWEVLGEDGEYTDTKIPVSGVTVSGSEAEGYTFTIVNANGESQTVELPTAASAITELTLGGNTLVDNTESTNATVSANTTNFYVSEEEFNWNNQTGETGLNAASGWKGNKTIPNNGDWIFASPSKVDLRIDPVTVPAENIKFYLTNTNNDDLNPVVLTATGDPEGSDPMNSSQANGRAAVSGNGLWVLSMENQVVAKANESIYWAAIDNAATNGYVHAVNANHAFRSKYEIEVQTSQPEDLTGLEIKGVETNPYTITIGTTGNTNMGTPTLTDDVTFKVGTAYEVKGVQASALYDMYLTADDSDVKVYQLTFDQDKHTFTIGKNPDVSTVPAHFDLIVYTVANDGTVEKTTITIQINTEISTPAEYSLIEHNVNVSDDANHFGIDLAIMKNALGSNLDQWTQNVDLTATNVDYEWSEYEDRGFAPLSTINGITAKVVSELDDNSETSNITTDRNNANYIQVDVNNSSVNGLKLDKTYYIRVTFNNSSSQILSQITVPVEFHAPALSDLFTIKEGYQEEGSEVINAYFYQIAGVTADGINFTTTSTQVYLDRFFSEYVPLANIDFASGNVGETGHDGAWLFDLNNATSAGHFGHATDAAFGHMTLNFDATNTGIKADGTTQNGYGETVTINATKSYFNTDKAATAGWLYTEDGADKYSFQIRLMSPIAEGKVVPVEGSAITIDGNDLATGASITNEMIEGRTYNNVRYSIVPDDNSTRATNTSIKIYETAGVNTVAATDYKDPQIQTILPATDKDNYLQSVEVWSAYTLNREEIPGELKIKSSSISRDMTIQLPIIVTDAWDVVTEQEVPVSIKFNN